jgi:6-pyruvoyltetrahydropterin/6-carboxytetrahydropterin synthase
MYYLRKTFTFSAAHRLALPYESPCNRLHGHNWAVTVHMRSKALNESGMIEDFKHIKDKIQAQFDHATLNDFMGQPTAERIARHIHDALAPHCYRVDVEESEGSVASYVEDEICTV